MIEARRNSSRRARVSTPRKPSSAVGKLDDYGGWRGEKKHGYGVRWMVEAAFSAFKRTSGGHIQAKSLQNMVGEPAMKANLYNLFISMNP